MELQPTTPTREKQSHADELLSGELVRVPRVGDMVSGVVVSVSKSEVYLDIDGYGLGVVRGPELLDESGEHNALKVGDHTEATILELENERAELELSFRTAGHKKAWKNLEDLRRAGNVIEAPVVDANRGGLIVRVGKIEGFLPVSQLLAEHYPRVEGGDKNKILEKLRSFIGKPLAVRIIDAFEREDRLIVSEKAAREEKQKEKLKGFDVGQTIGGTVSGLVDFGAFVQFGEGLEGLIHISELAWQRILHPKEVLEVGQKLEAKIIGISGGRVSLSRKALLANPWEEFKEKIHVGDIILGTVAKVDRFGIFVEIAPGLQGLVHVSELEGGKELENLFAPFPQGTHAKWRVLAFEPARQRLALSGKGLSDEGQNAPPPPKPNPSPTDQPSSL